MDTLYNIGDKVKLSAVGLQRNDDPINENDKLTFGNIGLWPNPEKTGLIAEVRDDRQPQQKDIWYSDRAKARNTHLMYVVVFDSNGRSDYYRFSEDELQLDSDYIQVKRAETEMAEILERQWIEDVL
jgi:hypothetical protein